MSPRTELPDDAHMVRGGQNLPENFTSGTGVLMDTSGLLQDVSVNCGAGKSVSELARVILNEQIGVTTLGAIRAAGGDVVPAPTQFNPDHCLLQGTDAQMASRLFTPTIPNPGKVR